MIRRLIALAAAGIACPAIGCVRDSLHSAPLVSGKVVETPVVTQASAEIAERVDDVGSDLLTATALGIPNIDFYTISSNELELFHRDTRTLYISDSLVSRCQSDDELAAVLALEMGKMTAEFRRGLRRQVKDPIPAVASAPKYDGSTDLDPARDAYLVQFDRARQAPSDKREWPTIDPQEIAAELLRNAGREPKLLKDVTPLLKHAADGPNALRLGGTSPAPKWSW